MTSITPQAALLEAEKALVAMRKDMAGMKQFEMSTGKYAMRKAGFPVGGPITLEDGDTAISEYPSVKSCERALLAIRSVAKEAGEVQVPAIVQEAIEQAMDCISGEPIDNGYTEQEVKEDTLSKLREANRILYAPPQSPAGKEVGEDEVMVPRGFRDAAYEFLKDWQKGDCKLEGYAALDAAAMLEAIHLEKPYIPEGHHLVEDADGERLVRNATPPLPATVPEEVIEEMAKAMCEARGYSWDTNELNKNPWRDLAIPALEAAQRMGFALRKVE